LSLLGADDGPLEVDGGQFQQEQSNQDTKGRYGVEGLNDSLGNEVDTQSNQSSKATLEIPPPDDEDDGSTEDGKQNGDQHGEGVFLA